MAIEQKPPIPLVIASTPKPVSKMTDAEINEWSARVYAGMAAQQERLTGEKLPVSKPRPSGG